jgi:hypothetical protein
VTFEILVLICGLGVEPRDCMPGAGARVVEKIGEEHSELACIRQGALSSGGAISKPKEGEFEKIMCVRKG